MARYSLTDYIVTVKLPEAIAGYTEITIGGEGSYVQSIDIAINGTLYTTQGDDTGSYVHNKSLNRTGSCDISLNMLADKAVILRNICNCFYKNDYDKGMEIIVEGLDGTTIATCHDCYIAKMPNYNISSSAGNQTWSFTCGQVIFE